MLVRREGRTVTAFPLAGSTPRTGVASIDDQAARDLLMSGKNQSEHKLVVDHYRHVLEPLCDNLDIPTKPDIHETTEVIHLGTAIRGELKTDCAHYSALDLALMLHPTPAIGALLPMTPSASSKKLSNRGSFMPAPLVGVIPPVMVSTWSRSAAAL